MPEKDEMPQADCTECLLAFTRVQRGILGLDGDLRALESLQGRGYVPLLLRVWDQIKSKHSFIFADLTAIREACGPVDVDSIEQKISNALAQADEGSYGPATETLGHLLRILGLELEGS